MVSRINLIFKNLENFYALTMDVIMSVKLHSDVGICLRDVPLAVRMVQGSNSLLGVECIGM